MISTHTPLAGRDVTFLLFLVVQTFLLTRPLRDVTEDRQHFHRVLRISTHTPLAGRDLSERASTETYHHFYSHAPCGT